MVTNNAINVATAATGKVLRAQGIGVAPLFSTATYPDTAGTTGNVLTSDGTNWISSTGGSSVQQVRASTAATTSTAATMPTGTTPQNTNGAEALTLAITPKNASNILLLEVTGYVGIEASASRAGFVWALFQDSTAAALSASMCLISNSVTDATLGWAGIRHFMTAGTTSSTTFKLRFGTTSAASAVALSSTAGPANNLGGVPTIVMTITEFMP
jgi:hypothetical protein